MCYWHDTSQCHKKAWQVTCSLKLPLTSLSNVAAHQTVERYILLWMLFCFGNSRNIVNIIITTGRKYLADWMTARVTHIRTWQIQFCKWKFTKWRILVAFYNSHEIGLGACYGSKKTDIAGIGLRTLSLSNSLFLSLLFSLSRSFQGEESPLLNLPAYFFSSFLSILLCNFHKVVDDKRTRL